MTTDACLVGKNAPSFCLEAIGAGAERRSVRIEHFRGSWLTVLFIPPCPPGALAECIWAFSDRRSDFVEIGSDILGISATPIAECVARGLTPRAGDGGLFGLKICLASDPDGQFARLYRIEGACGAFVIEPSGSVALQIVSRRPIAWRPAPILELLAGCQGHADDSAAAHFPARLQDLFAPGKIVENYLVEEHIGDGSFSVVFRAVDLSLQRPVALKVVKPSTVFPPAALLLEARAIAALSHPCICTVYGVFDVEGIPVFAMELLRGQSLDNLLQRDQALPRAQAAHIGRQIAAAMAAAHASGIFHSDLKPANVLVADDGSVKVVDFGLARRDARAVDPDGTVIIPLLPPDAIVGTPSYMSPEQSFGKPALAASDVFSLGVILYQMVTGERPFAGRDTAEVVQRLRAVKPQVLASDLLQPFAAIVARALEPDPAERRITMVEIERLLSEEAP